MIEVKVTFSDAEEYSGDVKDLDCIDVTDKFLSLLTKEGAVYIPISSIKFYKLSYKEK